jgi:UDP-N-acetylmuramoylalanine--D-glutamate ligase
MSKERIAILGGGESGVGAARLAAKVGKNVFVSDAGSIHPARKKELETLGLPYEEGGHTWDTIFESVEVIKSPGIPNGVPLIHALAERGIPVISEIEFAARYSNGQLIGITGSNGKTTTTLLTYHLLRSAGLDVGVAGNVGFSFAAKLAESDHAYWVLELSSFQLENIVHFHPRVAMLLNVTPDHLDRYNGDMRLYGAAKYRIGMNQGPEDVFLYRPGDRWSLELLPTYAGAGRKVGMPDAATDGSTVITCGSEAFDLATSSLRGAHNWQNAAFAIEAALQMGVSPAQVRKGLQSFQNAPHRLEFVGAINGVDFINDSKATNVDAVWFALDAMTQPVIWIAGGTDKGNDYTPINGLVRDKVKGLICLGMDNQKLKEQFGYLPEVWECQSAEESVRLAMTLAEKGDVVLLSPACASFDLFKNYEDRGDQFRAAVQKMMNVEF